MRRHPPQLMLAFLFAGVCACDPPDTAPPRAGLPGIAGAATVRGDSMTGAALSAAFGCGACHPGAPIAGPDRAIAPSLAGLAERWDVRALVAYLQDPVPLREGALERMPDFHLDPGEATAVAMHLLREDRSRGTRSALQSLAREHPGATAARGAAMVDALNCAGCHAGTGAAPWAPGPPVAAIRGRLRGEWLRGYLTTPVAVRPFGYRPGSGSRMPDFGLSRAEADSLTAWLTGPADGAESGARVDDEAGAPSPPLSPFRSSKAQDLLTHHLPCLGCHALNDRGGRIGPALDGAGARLRPIYLRRIVTEPGRAAPGTMMPRPLEDSATLELIIDYLRDRREPGAGGRYLSLLENEPVRPELTPPPDAIALYGANCAPCHGRAGGGDGFNAAYLPAPPTVHADPDHMATRPDATLFDGIHAGGHILGRSHRMPAFGATLSASEIRALVAHMRGLCACTQPEWAGP